jgi:DNA-binding NtrC family response regulator
VASIVAIGPDAALLEGIAQTLIGAGHQVLVAHDIPEAIEQLQGNEPLVALVECDELLNRGAALKSSIARGGALVTFHCDGEWTRPPFSFQRSTLAELSLPLEKQRLLALIKYVEARVEATGRSLPQVDTRRIEPETRSS